MNPFRNGGGVNAGAPKAFAFPVPCDTLRFTVKLHEYQLIWKSGWTPVFVNKQIDTNNTNNTNKT